jgi:superfamily II DNA or RNA helicase
MESLDLEVPDLMHGTGWRYRDYQLGCLAKTDSAWQEGLSRIMAVLAGGMGKTIIFAAEAHRAAQRGQKALILADTEELCAQAAEKLFASTGMVADIEKADSHASLSSPVVVASVQTISRTDRLMGFPDDHFGLVIADECDLSMAPTWQRVLRYFCFGRESLEAAWVLPKPTEARPTKARILGVTATPYLPTLGTFFQKIVFKYRLKEAVRDGWLVKPIVRQMPGADMNNIKISRSRAGADLDAAQVIEHLKPFLRGMCAALVTEATDRKTLVFVPSVEIARNCAEMVRELNRSADFVSGDCVDRSEKVLRFKQGYPQFLFNALLLKRGFDDAGIRAVSLWRPTQILSFYEQVILRGTRPMPNTIERCFTREERLAAIAASAKPDFLIIDPLWLSDRHNLVAPVDLVTAEPEVRERMLRDNKPDLVESEVEASIELLISLEREASKHVGKEARTIDPLAFAEKVGDEEMKHYEPTAEWEFMPPTDDQVKVLRGWGFQVDQITNRGLATRIIDRKRARDKLGLCTPSQMEFLTKIGYQNAGNIEKNRAAELMLGHRRQWAERKNRAHGRKEV